MEIENKTKKMKEQEKEDKFSLIKNSENKNEVDIHEDKMKDSLRNYIMDKRRIVYHRLEGMEPGDDLSLDISNDIALKMKNRKILSNRKIGSNVVLFKRCVLGTIDNILILLSTMLGMGITWFGWAYTNKNFYSFKTLFICFISYFITNFFMFISFLVEPGIIPREHPKYIKKNFEQDEKEDNKDENKEVIPRIFKERFCNTCKIVRPPGTSHCRVCDNCVQNYDHHCFYISNCVGKRNHKYFYLFLFSGTIGSVKMVILGFISLYKLFIINAKETLFIYYKEDKVLFIICAATTIVSILCAMGGLRNILCAIFEFLMSFGIFSYLWYKHFYNKNNNPNIYYNPLIILFYVSSIYFFIFVFTTFCGQSYYIASGYTIKQTQSIKNEIIDLVTSRSEQKIKNEYTRKKTCKEGIKNIIKFLKADIGESLIKPERDLIY